jgi:phage-related holin
VPEFFYTLQDWIVWLWGQWQTQVLAYHILVNVVLAIAVSVRTGEFVLAKTGAFLWKKLLPYVLVYAALAFCGEAIDQGGIATVAWGLIETALLGDMLDNLSKLGIPVPEALTKNRLPS